ncbi:MAG: alpha-L-fucosidase [Bacteroidetes bacterium]|nr:alpha-L-fucosidase [Bacteroidota bacterium]
MKRIFSILCGLHFCIFLNAQEKDLRPRPSKAQLDWHETNFYLFFHFGPNTFSNREWGQGTETEDLFNPGAIDCEQWARVAKLSGARGVVITAKHHDGFCLWPSRHSKHTVRESKWMDGKGDVLDMLRIACANYYLKLGVYLSPWDRNHPDYGTPHYNDVYAETLTELLTRYGNLFEIWFDGANGEGPNGKKQVYDFHRFEKIAKTLQPNAVVFSDIGPGCRWAGNENGTIGITNWCMLDTAGFTRGAGAPTPEVLQSGQENGHLWIPAECDVSIRPGWFYHPEEDSLVKTPDQLWDIYLKSVGRGANLILNVPPDRQGRIHPKDSLALVRLGQRIYHTFKTNLVKKPEKFTGQVDLSKNTRFNTLMLREDLQYGQSVAEFEVEIQQNGVWKPLVSGTTVGNKRIFQFPDQTARKIRVKVKRQLGPVHWKSIGIYKA